MPVPILMPALSPTMTEGNIAKWLKKEGDLIKPGDVIAEVETDKATMEVESIDEGNLAKILSSDGEENVKVNSLIGVIALSEDKDTDIDNFITEYLSKNNLSKDSNDLKNIDDEKSNDTSLKANKKKVDKTESLESSFPQAIEPKKDPINAENYQNNNSRLEQKDENNNDEKAFFISPLAKRIANINNINLNNIRGSGPKGRIIKRDLDSHLISKPENIVQKKESEQIVLSNIRKTIAKRLLESKQNIPHYYLKCKICVDALLDSRIKINNFLSNNSTNAKISLNDLFIKATALSLTKVPMLNATWNENSIISYNSVDIGIAVAAENGLFTPIIKNANEKTVSQISEEMKIFVKKVYENKLIPEDYEGGNFSISNLGMYNIDEFSAIINPPQAGILAIGGISKEVYLEEDKPLERNVITFTLSVDHRIADGAQAAKFFDYFKYFVANPVGMIV